MNNVERFDELYNINTMTTQKGKGIDTEEVIGESGRTELGENRFLLDFIWF